MIALCLADVETRTNWRGRYALFSSLHCAGMKQLALARHNMVGFASLTMIGCSNRVQNSVLNLKIR